MTHKNKRTFTPLMACLCGLLLLLLGGSYRGQGQVIVPAKLTDNPFGIAPGPNNIVLNSAVIDYSATCTACTGANQLMAVTVTDGTTNLLHINDGVSPGITVPIGGGVMTPDVAIFNNTNNSLNYYVAVVINALNASGPPPGYIETLLLVWEVTGVGSGSMSLVSVSPTTFNLSQSFGNGAPEIYPHIDGIAQYNNTFPGAGGLPTYDKFMVIWTDESGVAPYDGHNISYGSISDLVSGASIPVVPFNDPTPVTPGTYDDIAAIERMNGTSDDFMGLYVTHVGPAPGFLFYNEFNQTSLATTGPIVFLDAPPLAPWSYNPRIDAIDDININTKPGLTPFVVANGYLTHIRTYDWQNAGPTPPYPAVITTDVTAPLLSGWLSTFPTVTTGGLDKQGYTVGHYTRDGFAHMYAEYIEASSGRPVGYPAFDNYQVNMTQPILSGSQSDCISSTCNTQFLSPQYLFSCWVSGGLVFYKLQNSSPYFREGGEGTTKLLNSFSCYPNPVKDVLVLTADEDNAASAKYIISDVTGRSIFSGNFTAIKQEVNVSSLASGMYVVSLYNGNKLMKTEKVVKE